MSPVVKRKGERFTLPSKYLLFILTILCTIMMLVTFGTNVFNRPFNRVVGYVIVPFEQGIAKAGEWLANRSDELVQIRTLLAENSALKAVSYTHLDVYKRQPHGRPTIITMTETDLEKKFKRIV